MRRGTRGGRMGPGGKDSDDRDYSYYNRDDYQQNSQYISPVSIDRNRGPPERNDCEIIVVSKTLT